MGLHVGGWETEGFVWRERLIVGIFFVRLGVGVTFEGGYVVVCGMNIGRWRFLAVNPRYRLFLIIFRPSEIAPQILIMMFLQLRGSSNRIPECQNIRFWFFKRLAR